MKTLKQHASELYETVWHLCTWWNVDIYQECEFFNVPSIVAHVVHGFVDRGWHVDEIDVDLLPPVVTALETYLAAVDGVEVDGVEVAA